MSTLNSSSSAPVPAATRPRSTRPTSACRSRSSIRSRIPAASASIAAASRRRRCCTSPRSSTRRSTRRPGASTFGAAEDRPRQAARVQGQGRHEADRRRRPGREAAQDRRTSRARRRSSTRSTLDIEPTDGGTRARSTFEHAIIATGSRPATVPGLLDRQPARDGLDRRARPARHPEVAARRRRRLHRPRAGHGLRRARHEGHGRRDDRRPAARRRSRPRHVLAKRLERDAARRSCSNTQGRRA